MQYPPSSFLIFCLPDFSRSFVITLPSHQPLFALVLRYTLF